MVTKQKIQQPKSTEKCTAIIKALAEKHIEFNTYQPKEDTSFRAALRGMHYSTDIRDIKTELGNLGHTVVNIFNIKQNRTNILLSLFFVDIKRSGDKDIYQIIETENYTKVKFEPPSPKRNTPQCSKCQRYGHTQASCYRIPRCVKCVGSLLTKQCPRKEKSENVKFVLCDGNHPANYKGGAVYRDLQKRTFPPLRSKQVVQTQENVLQNPAKPIISYAALLKSPRSPLETTKPQPQQQTTYKQQQTPSSDIDELKVMMKGLMEQMGTMLQLLKTLVSEMA